MINRRLQHYRRYRQIVEVLIRHGFGYVVEQVDLRHLVPVRWRWFRRVEVPKDASLGVRLRRVAEELGPTFVKLGQVISARSDILSPNILAELSRLQDEVPSFPVEDAHRIIEEQLGCPIDEIFEYLSEDPLAAASIAQVHRGRLRTGEDVVVKVRRPEIETVIETDIDIMLSLARLAKERMGIELFDPVQIVHEFARVIRKELDFRIEGRHLQRFFDNFEDVEDIHIPKVYWEYTTSKLLVMEYIEGAKISDEATLEQWGVDRTQVARRGAEAFLKQVMVDGYFHGDPHPGNLLVRDDGMLAFIDFGVVGRLDRHEKDALVDMFIGVVRVNVDGIIHALRRVQAIGTDIDLISLRSDLSDLIDRHYGKRLDEIEMGGVLSDLLEVAYRHRVRLPADFLLLGKAFVTMEGVGRSLDPRFNVVEIAEPFARRLIAERYSPERLVEKVTDSSRRTIELLSRLPFSIDETFAKLSDGELEIVFRHKGLDRLINRLDIISNRISFSLIIGALIVGSSFIIQSQIGPMVMGMPLIGVIGYGVAGFIGMGLVFSIIRSGRL